MAGKDSQRGVPRQGSAPSGGETGKGDTSWFACGFADRGQNRKGGVCRMEGNQRVFLFGQRLCRGGPLFASGSSVLPPCPPSSGMKGDTFVDKGKGFIRKNRLLSIR